MTYRPLLAVLSALAAAALVAVVVPRFSDDGAVSWLVTIGLGAVIGVAVLLATRQETDAA